MDQVKKTAPQVATFADFRNYHNMFCSPSAAMRCIKAFDGCVLFMPNTYNTLPEESGWLDEYDYQGGLLNIVSYYFTVLLV